MAEAIVVWNLKIRQLVCHQAGQRSRSGKNDADACALCVRQKARTEERDRLSLLSCVLGNDESEIRRRGRFAAHLGFAKEAAGVSRDRQVDRDRFPEQLFPRTDPALIDRRIFARIFDDHGRVFSGMDGGAEKKPVRPMG